MIQSTQQSTMSCSGIVELQGLSLSPCAHPQPFLKNNSTIDRSDLSTSESSNFKLHVVLALLVGFIIAAIIKTRTAVVVLILLFVNCSGAEVSLCYRIYFFFAQKKVRIFVIFRLHHGYHRRNER